MEEDWRFLQLHITEIWSSWRSSWFHTRKGCISLWLWPQERHTKRRRSLILFMRCFYLYWVTEVLTEHLNVFPQPLHANAGIAMDQSCEIFSNDHSSIILTFQLYSVRYWERCKTGDVILDGPPLWSSGHSSWLQIQRFRVRLPALQDFLRINGSGTGSTQPHEYNWEDTWKK
jgi:hypothetical protein